MVQGSDLNLQTFVEKYLYDFSSSLTVNDHIVSTTEAVTSQEKESEHSIPENSIINNEDEDDHDDLSELTDGTDLSDVSILTESDLKLLEEQFEQKLSKLQKTIEAQNVNYRDLEVQFLNKMKQQIQEFTDKLNEQQENFNSKTILLKTEIKRLNKECTDLKGRLKQAQKEINFINVQLKDFPPVSSIKHNTSLKFPLPPNSIDYIPETPYNKQQTNVKEQSHDNPLETDLASMAKDPIIPQHQNRYSLLVPKDTEAESMAKENEPPFTDVNY